MKDIIIKKTFVWDWDMWLCHLFKRSAEQVIPGAASDIPEPNPIEEDKNNALYQYTDL